MWYDVGSCFDDRASSKCFFFNGLDPSSPALGLLRRQFSAPLAIHNIFLFLLLRAIGLLSTTVISNILSLTTSYHRKRYRTCHIRFRSLKT